MRCNLFETVESCYDGAVEELLDCVAIVRWGPCTVVFDFPPVVNVGEYDCMAFDSTIPLAGQGLDDTQQVVRLHFVEKIDEVVWVRLPAPDLFDVSPAYLFECEIL